ncbi:MAG: hypothetical protein M1829_003062 [Trizodia sp. TS-e1964]|nr:MAG: hypothetical protein M1829_003062 [Trizodia sp. TS-e1964]
MDLESVLDRLGLTEYLTAFLNEGFDTWETLLDITESDLTGLEKGMLLMSSWVTEECRLQREISRVRGLTQANSLETDPANSPAAAAAEERGFEGEEVMSPAEKEQHAPRKRKYNRHPRVSSTPLLQSSATKTDPSLKADENAPERPRSAYVIFSNKSREDLKGTNLAFTDIARVVGQRWQLLSPEQKRGYEALATASKERYAVLLEAYKQTPQYADFQKYLEEFRAKEAAAQLGRSLTFPLSHSLISLHTHAWNTTKGKRAKLGVMQSTSSSTSDGADIEPEPDAGIDPETDSIRRRDSVTSLGAFSASDGFPSPHGLVSPVLPRMTSFPNPTPSTTSFTSPPSISNASMPPSSRPVYASLEQLSVSEQHDVAAAANMDDEVQIASARERPLSARSSMAGQPYSSSADTQPHGSPMLAYDNSFTLPPYGGSSVAGNNNSSSSSSSNTNTNSRSAQNLAAATARANVPAHQSPPPTPLTIPGMFYHTYSPSKANVEA